MKLLGKIFATISVIFILPPAILAYPDSSRIGATVKISVCGDNTVEGSEECEQGLGIQYNCQQFGFAPKPITCDISCAYDLLNCKSKEAVAAVVNEDNIESMLPILLDGWDTNNDGILEMEEFTSFIINWVNSWKSFVTLPRENSEKETVARQCDINADNTCNVTDFSVILYYLNND